MIHIRNIWDICDLHNIWFVEMKDANNDEISEYDNIIITDDGW
jgi:hypothetical protein